MVGCGICGSGSEKVWQFPSWSLNVWHFWNRVCEGVAHGDNELLKAWHLWNRACDGVAPVDNGLLKVWHMKIIFREGMALVKQCL